MVCLGRVLMGLLGVFDSLIVTACCVVLGCGPMGLGCILMMLCGLLMRFVCHKFPLS